MYTRDWPGVEGVTRVCEMRIERVQSGKAESVFFLGSKLAVLECFCEGFFKGFCGGEDGGHGSRAAAVFVDCQWLEGR